jgi:predicted dehydrogenase
VSKLRIAIVGCGYWGQNLVRNFSDLADVEVTAVCDFNLNTLARIKRRYPALELKHDYQQLLADSRIGAVVIATPLSTHYPFAQQALQSGRHVLVEKPMATNSEHALRLMELADRYGTTLMVDHTFIYTGAVRHIKSVVERGDPGDLLYYDSVRISLGFVQTDINVVWDLASHDFSIMDHLCKKRPVGISAVGAKHLRNPFENMAYLTVHFEDSMIAHFHVNWLAPVKVRQTLIGGTRQMIVYDDTETTEKVRIYNRNLMEADDSATRDKVRAGHRIGDMVAPNLDTTEALHLMAREFVDSVSQKRQPATGGSAGYRVVRLLEAAQLSMENMGNPVELKEWPLLPTATPSLVQTIV